MFAGKRFGIVGLMLCWPMLGMSQSDVDTHSTKMEQMLNELQQVRRISGISLSPDGRWVSWSQGLGGEDTGNQIFLFDSKNPSTPPRQIKVPESTASTQNERVAWSYDSANAAFLSKPDGRGQSQIFTFAVADGVVHQVTKLTGYMDAVRWSPDGKELAFVFAEGGGGGGPLTAQAARVGQVDEQLHNQRITLIPAVGGDIREVSPADLNVYEYDWSRDGKQFTAIAAPGPADNNWWIAQLYVVDGSGGPMRVIYKPTHQQQIAIPRWSPDGTQVAFIEGLMSDQGFVGGDITVVPAAGGPARDLTRAAHFSTSSLEWQDSQNLIFTASLAGGGAIGKLRADSTGASELLWKGGEDLHEAGNIPDMAISSDGAQTAVVRSTWQRAPEVWAGPIGNWTQVTHLNEGQRPHWGKSESITWTSGTFHAQGWLLYPENYDSSKRYPMVVSIHGGPSGQHSPSWPTTHFDMSLLSGLGYFVFFPNPRGSYGEGEAFTRANVKDFGGGDFKDVLAGVDTVLKKAPIDNQRLGVTGWSYGGFMTMWTVTQTNRFRAAVAGAGISDWLSYYGENSIDQWMIPFFGSSVYDDPAVYAKSSPITYIKRVKTPTLVLVGERDAECPAPQSFEFWHALKALNVPAKLVVYPGQGHAFDDPKDNLDRQRRTVAWFDEYLKSGVAQ